MTKEHCIASISTSLASTAQWRATIADKSPTDRRYARAAKNLAKLADEAQHLPDSSWDALEPFVASPQWQETVRQVSRQIGFSIRKASLQFFCRCLVRALSEPATAA